jgi:hypothetical protein
MQPDFYALVGQLKNSPLSGLIENLSEIYLVGGSLRDFLFGLPIVDYDFVVHSNDIDKISSYLDSKNMTHFFLSSGRIRLLRAVYEGVEYDFMPIHRTLKEDMQRRDFTMNAIYYNIKENTLYEQDKAFSDIDNRILRVVSASSISDDPIRIFRAIRFASCLDLTIEEQTLLSIRESQSLITSVKKERAREEIKKTFKCDFRKTTAVLNTIFGFESEEIIEKSDAVNNCKTFASFVNKDLPYGTLVHIALLEKTLPMFSFAFCGIEKRIIEGILAGIEDTSFEKLFERFLLTDPRVLMGALIVNLPLSEATKLCSIVENWSNIRVEGSEIKRASYDLGISLKEARIDILREKCKKIYDEI